MIKLILLDIDDTLCLTEEATFHIENYVAQKMGFKPMSREAHKKNWGLHLEIALPDRFPDIDIEQFMSIHHDTLPKFVKEGKLDAIPEENLKVLEKIRIKGLKISILTSRNLGEARHLLEDDHPLNKRVDAFYHKSNSDFVKPDPRVFDKVLKHFQVQPFEAVYVGDSVSDAVCSKKAGLYFIAVLESGLRTKEDFKGIKVDYFIKKFTDLYKTILNI